MGRTIAGQDAHAALWSSGIAQNTVYLALLFQRLPEVEFCALVSCDDDGPFRPSGRQQLVTVRLAGDDVADYFSVGGHFDVGMGDDVGQGVITRRLFV